MDIGEDQDVLLQRACSSYLMELKASLPKFLFHRQSSGVLRVRSRVRVATTAYVTSLLEPFQEWPQLLDPQLQDTVGSLADSLLKVSIRSNTPWRQTSFDDGLVISLDRAICKLLYTLCKIRGPKVIARLLNNEVETLEPMLEKLEEMVKPRKGDDSSAPEVSATWEEKYVHMLWLSHLLFAPFDLSTIGSSTPADISLPDSLQLPPEVPPIVSRLIGVSMIHLAAAGKERESAVKLLCRLAARPDMLRLGVHTRLIEWSLQSLHQMASGRPQTPYESIGVLSLLGSLSLAIGPVALEPLLLNVFKSVISNITETQLGAGGIASSAVARKAIVKILRVVSVSALQLSELSPHSPVASASDQILGDVIDFLLNSLADNDTPVRQSASKAISVIAARLPPEMAAEVVEAVVGSLEENVLWIETQGKLDILGSVVGGDESSQQNKARDLSAVNPLRWHGLVLALSQLLFQRSAPPSQLHSILNALLLALQFEKRATSGSSLGTNVRDAANFGIWSIARKYSSNELGIVNPPLVDSSFNFKDTKRFSTIQVIAGELVVAACLDPSGNIRRGSSAALQELIGRHPDAVAQGISLVQTVDYHAVALRSRALRGVTLAAAKLHRFYWFRLVDSLFGWRGLSSADAASRRLAAEVIGELSAIDNAIGLSQIARKVYRQLSVLKRRDHESRHGLLLAAAALARAKKSHWTAEETYDPWETLMPGVIFHEQDLVSNSARSDLVAEAISEVIRAFLDASSPERAAMKSPSLEIFTTCKRYIDLALQRRDETVIPPTAKAAAALFGLGDSEAKVTTILQWTRFVDEHLYPGASTVNCHGYLAALGEVYRVSDDEAEAPMYEKARSSFVGVLRKGSPAEIETKVAALQGVRTGIISKIEKLDYELIDLLSASLQDYTVDQRGDIGSLARTEAIIAVQLAAERGIVDTSPSHKSLIALVCTLAAEKIDKVRFTAWSCLQACRGIIQLERFMDFRFETIGQTSGVQYFHKLFSLISVEWLRRPLLQGAVVSAGSGSESVLRASRLALSQYCEDANDGELQVIGTILLSLLRDHVGEDRLAVPILETWAFIFQSHHAFRLHQTPDFSFKRLFVVVQKAHYKSGSLQKLIAAVEVYDGLAAIDAIKGDVIKKLNTLILHPIPKVRNNAADVVFRHTKHSQMLTIDWSRPPKDLKKDWVPQA